MKTNLICSNEVQGMTEDELEAWAERAAIAGEVVASLLLPKGMTSAQAWAEFDRVFKTRNPGTIARER